MASTTTTTLTETIYAKIITDTLIDAMYGAAVMDALMRQESLVGKPSLTQSFPVWPALTAASIAETSDLGSTAIDTTTVDIAVSEAAALRVDITDLLRESTVVRDVSAFANQAAKAVADKRDVDAATLLGGFSTVKGLSTDAMSRAILLSGIAALAMADAPKPYGAVLQPRQVGHLRDELVSTGAVVQSQNRPEDFGPGDGYEFTWIVPIWGTTNVPTADAGASFTGAMFSLRQALARVDKRPIRVEPQRDASGRLTEYVVTSVYGQGELVDSWGVTLKSKVAE
jgi:hypothetical protein